HPPDIGGLAAVVALVESGGQGLPGTLWRSCRNILFCIDKCRAMQVEKLERRGAPILLLFAIDRFSEVRKTFFDPRTRGSEGGMNEFVDQVDLGKVRLLASHGRQQQRAALERRSVGIWQISDSNLRIRGTEPL